MCSFEYFINPINKEKLAQNENGIAKHVKALKENKFQKNWKDLIAVHVYVRSKSLG